MKSQKITEIKSQKITENKIKRYLLDLGIRPDLKGFDCIVKAILIYSRDKNIAFCKLYEKVGEKLNISSTVVDRRIRNAIKKLQIIL